VNQFFHKLSIVTRAKDWRLSFVPFIMGCVYMWLWWFKLPFTVYIVSVTFLSLFTTVGFASLGYFINEFFDKASDSKAGKLNKLMFLSPTIQLAIFVITVLLTLLPWILLPTTFFSWLLIGLQILLFLVYSLPFPRLKESTYLSVIIDSLYAYVVPLILSFYTFSLIAGASEFPIWFYTFAVSVFFIGLRNIILHQVNDVTKDRLSGILTLPMVLGVTATVKTIRVTLLYETLFWLVTIFILSQLKWYAVMYGLLHIIIAFNTLKLVVKRNYEPSGDDLLINRSYLYLFPITSLVAAGTVSAYWWLVLPIHFLFLFPYYIIDKALLRTRRSYYLLVAFIAVDVRNAASKAVNYPIYYSFKAIGIDLVKEKRSAADVLLGKRKK